MTVPPTPSLDGPTPQQITLLQRDAETFFVYWNIDSAFLSAARDAGGERLVLRLCEDVLHEEKNDVSAGSYVERKPLMQVDVELWARRWHLPVTGGVKPANYTVQLGFLDATNSWLLLLESDVLCLADATANGAMQPGVDERPVWHRTQRGAYAVAANTAADDELHSSSSGRTATVIATVPAPRGSGETQSSYLQPRLKENAASES